MSETKFTPGPWKAVREPAIDYRPMQVITADGKSRIAVCCGGGPVAAVDGPAERANANLIAAAPALYAACEAMLPYLENFSTEEGYESVAAKLARAALAQAKGAASE